MYQPAFNTTLNISKESVLLLSLEWNSVYSVYFLISNNLFPPSINIIFVHLSKCSMDVMEKAGKKASEGVQENQIFHNLET